MNMIYRELSDRLRAAVPDLERVVERAKKSWDHVLSQSDDRDAYMDSVALNLHGFYSGPERLFEMIARRVDNNLPSGEVRHRELLLRMSREIEDVRPAVISERHALMLDEFRRFRHLVRNVYTMNLLPGRMSRLLSLLPDLWLNLRSELTAFADFTQDLSSQ